MIEYFNKIANRERGRPKKKWLEVRVMIREIKARGMDVEIIMGTKRWKTNIILVDPRGVV